MELLLAMGLLGIVTMAVYETTIVGLRAAGAAARREALRQQLASALQRLTRDMAVATDVDEAQDGRFQFDTPAAADVDYVYDGSADTLSRDDAPGDARILLRNLTSLDFNYFDNTGAELATPVAAGAEDTIRVVQVVATMTDGVEVLTVASATYARNL